MPFKDLIDPVDFPSCFRKPLIPDRQHEVRISGCLSVDVRPGQCKAVSVDMQTPCTVVALISEDPHSDGGRKVTVLHHFDEIQLDQLRTAIHAVHSHTDREVKHEALIVSPGNRRSDPQRIGSLIAVAPSLVSQFRDKIQSMLPFIEPRVLLYEPVAVGVKSAKFLLRVPGSHDVPVQYSGVVWGHCRPLCRRERELADSFQRPMHAPIQPTQSERQNGVESRRAAQGQIDPSASKRGPAVSLPKDRGRE